MTELIEDFAESLLQKNELILSDSGSMHKRNTSIISDVFDNNTFGSLDESYLEDVIDDIARGVDWFSKPSVFTTVKVFEELSRFSELLKNKYDFLNEKHTYLRFIPSQRSKNAKYKAKFINRNPKYVSDEENKRKLFSELAFKSNILASKAGKKVLEDDVRSGYFVGLVESLEDLLKIKKDTSLKYGNSFPDRVDYRTDEDLVARALYESQFKKTVVNLVSSDFDILWLTIGASLVIPNFKDDLLKVHIIDHDRIVELVSSRDYGKRQTSFIEYHGVKSVKDTSDYVKGTIGLALGFNSNNYLANR